MNKKSMIHNERFHYQYDTASIYIFNRNERLSESRFTLVIIYMLGVYVYGII